MKLFKLSLLTSTIIGFSALATTQTEFDLQATAYASAQSVQIKGVMSPKRIADEYIVRFKSNTKTQQVKAIAANINGQSKSKKPPVSVSPNGKMLGGRFNQAQLLKLSLDSSVAAIEVNQVVERADMGAQTQRNSAVPWGLDRIDQAELPLDNSFSIVNDAPSTHVYILDSGIKTSHADFAGRAVWDYTGDNVGASVDNSGHGTHLAGIVGSQSYGVARQSMLHAVKIIDSGNTTTLQELAWGMDYVNHSSTWPAVALLGVYAPDNSGIYIDLLDWGRKQSIVYAVPSGDSGQDACTQLTDSPDSLTVAASTINDEASVYSNHGSCVDVYAPGLYIKSTWHTSATANNTISHSPVAAAHVAGAMAVVRGDWSPCTPEEVYQKVLSYSVDGVLSNVPANSPNKLLNVPTDHWGYGYCDMPLIENHNYYRHPGDFLAYSGAYEKDDFVDQIAKDQWMNNYSAEGVNITDGGQFKLDSVTGKIESAGGSLTFEFDQPINAFGYSFEADNYPWGVVTVYFTDGTEKTFNVNQFNFIGLHSHKQISRVWIWGIERNARIFDLKWG